MLTDFGDAPDTGAGTGSFNYQTTLADNGPRHTTVAGLFLGNLVDDEGDATQNINATGDDVARANSLSADDEDGVVNPQVDLQLTIGTQPTVTLRATNTAGTNATLWGWIDYNTNGVFDNATERAQVVVGTGITNGTFTLTFPVVPAGSIGQTYARFRLSTDPASQDSIGSATDGEVEDYVAAMTAPSSAEIKPGGAIKLASGGTGIPALADVDSFGSSVASVGDLNGNGVVDLAVGARLDNTGGTSRGAVHILFRNNINEVSSSSKITHTSLLNATGTGLADGARFGSSLANLGLVNNDGVTDLAVGARGDSTGGTNRGAVYVLFLNTNGTLSGANKFASGGLNMPTLADGDEFGASLASVGDLNGDGIGDLAVGAFGDDTGGSGRGAVHILFLNSSGQLTGSTKIASGIGGGPTLADNDFFGRAVANVGDLDGDGVSDLAVGAPYDDMGGVNRGAVHILFLNANGTVKSSTRIASGTTNGPALQNNDNFGFSVANGGDLDGDGVTDLVVGAVRDDTGGTDRGAVHILFLNANGTVKSSTKIASGTTNGPAPLDDDNFGSSVANAVDLEGDGVVDLVVGATGDDTGGSARGAVHILGLNTIVTALRDFGDAPDSFSFFTGGLDYQTRLSQDGPRHTIVNGLHLGTRISGEVDALHNGNANGDDIGIDDEDGVVNPQVDLLLTAGTQPTVTLRATNMTGRDATLYGWIDTFANGLFGGARAQITVPTGTSNGTFTLTFPAVPSDVVTGRNYARFRLSTDAAAANPTGAANDGEVEDYRVSITRPSSGTVKTGGATKLASGGDNLPALLDGDRFGQALAPLGDLDGDGIRDVAIGAFRDDTNGPDRGAIYIQLLNANGTVKSSTKIASGTGGAPALPNGANFGAAIANLGDVDGDGVVDLAVGAYKESGEQGALYVLFLNSNGTVKTSTRIASGVNGGPTLSNVDRFGISLETLGDLNGDGRAELAVGAAGDDTGGTDRGAVYILRLSSSGTVESSLKLASGSSQSPSLVNGAAWGTSLANLGDLDGDGVADLAVGALRDGVGIRGSVTILRLNQDGTIKSNTPIQSGVNGGPTLNPVDYFGGAVASAGDLDGDGVTDLLVSSVGTDAGGTNRGAVHILRLNADGTVKASSVLTQGGSNMPVLANNDYFGTAIANLGDIDGDGLTDIAVGASGDDTGGDLRGAVHILRLGQNLAPTALALSANTIAENSASGTAIGTFTTTDPDAGNTFTYTLVAGTGSTDNGSFTIAGNQLQSNGVFDFEAKSSYAIRVRTTDQGGLTFEQTFTINVTNANETPTALALSANTIAENLASGTAIGTFTSTDPDAGNTFTYTLVAGTGSTDNALFTIAGNQLQSNAVFDFETKSSYAIRVRTTDQGGLTFEQTFTINVTNANETPTALTLSANTIAENSASGTAIGTFTTTDPDAGNTFTYTLVAGTGATDNASFAIAGNQLQSNAVFDFEAKSSYAIRVRTTDQGGLFFDQTFTVTVTDVNEVIPNTAPALDSSGNPFAILGAGSRQSTEMRQGTLVSDILARGAGGNPISDPDAGAQRGIALTAVDQSLGNFQYTLVTNNPQESDWVNVDAAGVISNTSALLLPTTARLRFNTGRIPHHASATFFLSVESKLDAGLTFRAWDRTTGTAGGRADTSTNGGSSAFSAATETSKVYFEVRLFRSFNPNASLNVYTLEAEFNALTGGAFQDRSTDAYTGFTVLLSAVPELGTSALFRLYFGIQFNDNGTETDMGYRYLTSNGAEAEFLESIGPASKRPQREGTYFRELGVSDGTATIGYVFTTQQPGTSELTQIYRTDNVNKPTRPPGTSEGGTPTSFKPQENGDHVYTTNTAFETTKLGTWRIESTRGFVRELNPNPVAASAIGAAAESSESAQAGGSQPTPAPADVRSANPVSAESSMAPPVKLLPATGIAEHVARLVATPGPSPVPVSPVPTNEPIQDLSAIAQPRSAASTSASVASTLPSLQTSSDTDWSDAAFGDLAFVTGVLTAI